MGRDGCKHHGVRHQILICQRSPDLIENTPQQPSLLLYYRCVALLSQKGLQALAGVAAATIESGKVRSLPPAKAKAILLAVNGTLSLLAETVRPLERRYVEIFLYATAGAQVQGSWVNAIGQQGEILLREIVVRNLWDDVALVVWKNDTSVARDAITQEQALQQAAHIKIVRLQHGFHCVFASEPDLSFRNADGKPLLAVEIKAGTDPAGAARPVPDRRRIAANGTRPFILPCSPQSPVLAVNAASRVSKMTPPRSSRRRVSTGQPSALA